MRAHANMTEAFPLWGLLLLREAGCIGLTIRSSAIMAGAIIMARFCFWMMVQYPQNRMAV